MLLHEIEAFGPQGLLNIVIEVPKGSDGKFKYDLRTGHFGLHRILPKGLSFPYDYGFIPSTSGEDGDPVDVLVLVEPQLFCGCIVSARLIGAIKGTQKGESGGRVRNDILLAVSDESSTWKQVKSLSDLPGNLLEQIEFFFVSYRNFQGKGFRSIARMSAVQAKKLVDQGRKRL